MSKAAGCAKKLFMIAHMPQVAELQRRLKYGYNEFAGHLEIDGVYGPQTEAALRLRILPRGQLRLRGRQRTRLKSSAPLNIGSRGEPR